MDLRSNPIYAPTSPAVVQRQPASSGQQPQLWVTSEGRPRLVRGSQQPGEAAEDPRERLVRQLTAGASEELIPSAAASATSSRPSSSQHRGRCVVADETRGERITFPSMLALFPPLANADLIPIPPSCWLPNHGPQHGRD